MKCCEAEEKDCILISVLMSVYNSEKTVSTAIDSILSQTLGNFELIICDDGSTDGSWEILKKYRDKDSRITIFQNEKNIGLGASLNKCLERAKGKYIARQDADDISAPERLEQTLDYLLEKDLPYVGCGVYVFDDNGVWSKRCFPEHITKHLIAQKNPIFHPTMVFKREVLECVNGYRSARETQRTEDYDLVMRLAAKNILGQNLQAYLYSVYEPPEAYLRHSALTRWHEVCTRFYGLRLMRAPAADYIYLIKPLVMMLVPRKLLRMVKKVQWSGEERKV